MNKNITPVKVNGKYPSGNMACSLKTYRYQLANAEVISGKYAFCFAESDQVVLVDLDIPKIENEKAFDELDINITKYDGRVTNIDKSSIIRLHHKLIHLKHDCTAQEEEALSFYSAELLIDNDGHLNTTNVKYLEQHQIRWYFGEVDTFGILSIELEWTDVDGHLHTLWVG